MDPTAGRGSANASRPAAILVFAPHKTGSTFLVALLHDLADALGLCFYSDNAAFLYRPKDRRKCAAPSCGHLEMQQRLYGRGDRGWGECTTFVSARLAAASSCASRPRCSAPRGLVWGPLRLPGEMRTAMGLLRGDGPWRWYVLLHQRHPLDALVSAYHSFGWSHPAAPEASSAQRRRHTARQAAVRNQSVDEYVLANAPLMRAKYAAYAELLAAPRGTLLLRSRYEDMVAFFSQWLAQLLAPLEASFSAGARAALLERLRRRHRGAFAPSGGHKRSVAPGAFVRELRPATIAAAMEQNGDWFAPLGYV
ncbi:hypothetical protein EMIHUDRAFT_108626 [Emiliania huxleyi CCMP1516]|uniref:Sulfotransferase domain-containing protein n=2 Tax=Emiliania huxleyi TaxID=2903 RepID=A0A0D3KWI0_EMIH1|nr:hypothetical protein EMIHUDRAFT_108626 [Emiliania huxleyi CCMP1516]EOD40115.1 hypothetical protein EMIHUDRAFT_108626 [Emiliania huxleyi CCMP1516]|eukprot:XP_005792544.1 hypothetical protein EMIHUDRAFT_108626 [Emiliania huxleyi CCMP1516]